MNKKKPELVVAMDFEDAESAFKLAEQLKGKPVYLKIHWVLFPLIGFDGLIRLSRMFDERIFLDFKLHDIPSVVAKGIQSLMRIVPFGIIDLHAAGGAEMLRTARDVRDKTFKEGCACSKPPLLLGVTILTSISSDILPDIGSRFDTTEDAVLAFGTLAKNMGMDGIVASVHEAPAIRKSFGDDFKILTPGIRPHGFDSGDQARVATPSKAKELGSDFIVVGRPIIQSENPLAVVEQILHELND